MTKKNAARELARLCCRALESKMAEDLRVLDVSGQSSITDYLVLASGTSEPHLRALRQELEQALKAAQVHLVGREASPESGWTVVDAFDVMVHLFTPEQREHYRLEALWKDAPSVAVEQLLAEPKAAKPGKKAAARRPAQAKPRPRPKAKAKPKPKTKLKPKPKKRA